MTEKTKTTFNSAEKQVYKYNIVKNPKENINYITLLNSIQKNGDTLNGKIDEYYCVKIPLDTKRALHKIQFTINE